MTVVKKLPEWHKRLQGGGLKTGIRNPNSRLEIVAGLRRSAEKRNIVNQIKKRLRIIPNN